MKKGFTIIEGLVVVAIVAILAAIAIPGIYAAQREAKRKSMPHACEHMWHEGRCQNWIPVKITTSRPDGSTVTKELREQCECLGAKAVTPTKTPASNEWR